MAGSIKRSLEEFDQDLVSKLEKELKGQVKEEKNRRERSFPYIPFEGHQSRLGHYYRHLYQAVKYVDQQKILTPTEKYEYVKTIRAQLSNHEQALLLLNSLSPMGSDWWKDKFILEYQMVKNIPREFFDCEKEIDTSVFFKPKYFEWEDVKLTT